MYKERCQKETNVKTNMVNGYANPICLLMVLVGIDASEAFEASVETRST